MKVLAFTGSKGSGKNTLANILTGVQLVSNDRIDSFSITEKGGLIINIEEASGVVDMLQPPDSEDAYRFLINNIWPYVKQYSFATALKRIAVDIFQCPAKAVYGSDSDKNTIVSHLLWENMPGVVIASEIEKLGLYRSYQDSQVNFKQDLAELGITLSNKSGPMTVREFLQYLGTEIGRRMYSKCWTDFFKNEITSEMPALAIVTDMRFVNELETLREIHGEDIDVKVVKLTGGIKGDGHVSENGIPDELVDFVLDTNSIGPQESFNLLVQKMKEWNWFDE